MTADLLIGISDWTGHEAPYDGLIDDVRLYSTDLSAAQIASLAAYHRQGFTYDKLGNRLTLSEPRDDATTTYTYDNVTNELATINSVSVTYDAAGNMTADHRGYSYAYDYENRLVKITEGPATIAEFTYDALGRRIQTVANSTTTRYYYDNWRVVAETDDQAAIQRVYVYGNYLDEALLMIDKTGQSDVDYYYVHDHLFSPAALLSDAGVVLERYEYDAYGEPRFYDKDFVLLSTQASSYDNPIMFTGQRLDRLDSGDLLLMNYKARVYDPGTGRFLQHDPIGYDDGMNLYQYVQSRPTLFLDSYGLLGGLPDDEFDVLLGGAELYKGIGGGIELTAQGNINGCCAKGKWYPQGLIDVGFTFDVHAGLGFGGELKTPAGKIGALWKWWTISTVQTGRFKNSRCAGPIDDWVSSKEREFDIGMEVSAGVKAISVSCNISIAGSLKTSVSAELVSMPGLPGGDDIKVLRVCGKADLCATVDGSCSVRVFPFKVFEWTLSDYNTNMPGQRCKTLFDECVSI